MYTWANFLDDSRQSWSRISSKFKVLWKNYLYQSFIAVIVLTIVLFILSMEYAVVIASIGATAFIVFTMPKSITASPRRVIGGHIIGFACGSLAALIPHHVFFTDVAIDALAVGVSIFLMVALDFEHPPASGTALGVAINGFSLGVMTTVIASSIVISLAHVVFRRYLRDLT